VPSSAAPSMTVDPPGAGEKTDFPGYSVLRFTASGKLKRIN
jgi:hypothetical protein